MPDYPARQASSAHFYNPCSTLIKLQGTGQDVKPITWGMRMHQLVSCFIVCSIELEVISASGKGKQAGCRISAPAQPVKNTLRPDSTRSSTRCCSADGGASSSWTLV